MEWWLSESMQCRCLDISYKVLSHMVAVWPSTHRASHMEPNTESVFAGRRLNSHAQFNSCALQHVYKLKCGYISLVWYFLYITVNIRVSDTLRVSGRVRFNISIRISNVSIMCRYVANVVNKRVTNVWNSLPESVTWLTPLIHLRIGWINFGTIKIWYMTINLI